MTNASAREGAFGKKKVSNQGYAQDASYTTDACTTTFRLEWLLNDDGSLLDDACYDRGVHHIVPLGFFAFMRLRHVRLNPKTDLGKN